MRIGITGDLMQHSRNHNSEYSRQNSYKDIFSEKVLEVFSTCDVVIGQLETNIDTKKISSGYQRFNSHINFLRALKSAGIDILCTANNHSLDLGAHSYANTIKNIIDSRMHPVGSSLFSKTFQIKGKKSINVINFTNISNNENKSDTLGSSLITHENIMKYLRLDASCHNIAIFHDGEEYVKEITSSQYGTINFLKSISAKQSVHFDAIISNHSHVIGDLNNFDVFNETYYSNGLGNTISWQKELDEQLGLLVVLNIDENSINTVEKYKTETVFTKEGFQQVVLRT